MVPPNFIRPDSNLHRTNIELYQRHHDLGDGTGRCATCGLSTPCPARCHAAAVIRGAGEDPRWHDGHLLRQAPPAQTHAPHVAAMTPLSVDHPQQSFAGLAPRSCQLPVQPPVSPQPHSSLDTPGVTGFAVGGKSGRANVPYFDYER